MSILNPAPELAPALKQLRLSGILDRILPGSIVVRVLTLYTLSWFLCISSLTYFFYRHEFAHQVETAQEAALVMMEVTAFAGSVTASAVLITDTVLVL